VWSTQKKPTEEEFLTPLTPFGTTNGESFRRMWGHGGRQAGALLGWD